MILSEKKLKIIATIEDGITFTQLHYAVRVTYSHLSNTLKELEDIGIIYSKRGKKERRIYLTDKGKKVKQLVVKLSSILR